MSYDIVETFIQPPLACDLQWLCFRLQSAITVLLSQASAMAKDKALVPFWGFIWICALFLALNTVDVLLVRQQPDTQVPSIVQDKQRDFPFEISLRWATHEILRIRRLSDWFSLHTIPVLLWLPLSMAQMVPQFRSSNLERHRRIGIFLLATSSVMSLAVGMLLVQQEDIYGTSFSLRNLFTFSSWAVVALAWWIYCGVQGYRYRPAIQRSKKNTDNQLRQRYHRWYMCHFLANGYATGTSRLLNLGYMLWKHPKNGGDAMEIAEFDRATDMAVWASLLINFVGAQVWIWSQGQGKNEKTKTN